MRQLSWGTCQLIKGLAGVETLAKYMIDDSDQVKTPPHAKEGRLALS